MNILEAYIKKYGQIIIVILGLPCTNKSEIAKELEFDLNLPIINSNDYLIPNKYIETEHDGTKFKIYESSENYDWEKLNKDVNELKTKGVILYGNYIDNNKVDFEIDYCFFYSMNTTLCKKKILDKKILDFDNSEEKVNTYFEKIFNPFYENLKNDMKINKFYNIKEDTAFDLIYDETFDNLMSMIQKKLTKPNNEMSRNRSKRKK
jgi:broad-specificity NMP kinase